MEEWSDQEIGLINEVEIFRLKPSIMQKAEDRLIELRDKLVFEIDRKKLAVPPKTDIVKGQIVRGENHKGFPFVSLDMPQRFSRDEMFTYRVLFWWGHCLAFSFILKGEALETWLSKIMERRESKEDIYFSLAPSPWEWELSDLNYIPLSRAFRKDLKSAATENQYVKLARFRPVSTSSFRKLNWVNEGLDTFRVMTGLFMD